MKNLTVREFQTSGHERTGRTNVGTQGGDLQSRIFSFVLLVGLSWSTTPYSGISIPILKVFSLLTGIIGAALLMMGLVFSRKTHYAGILLLVVPLTIYWVAGTGSSWVASSIGVLSLIAVIQNIITRRCGINKLLNINSCGG